MDGARSQRGMEVIDLNQLNPNNVVESILASSNQDPATISSLLGEANAASGSNLYSKGNLERLKVMFLQGGAQVTCITNALLINLNISCTVLKAVTEEKLEIFAAVGELSSIVGDIKKKIDFPEGKRLKEILPRWNKYLKGLILNPDKHGIADEARHMLKKILANKNRLIRAIQKYINCIGLIFLFANVGILMRNVLRIMKSTKKITSSNAYLLSVIDEINQIITKISSSETEVETLRIRIQILKIDKRLSRIQRDIKDLYENNYSAGWLSAVTGAASIFTAFAYPISTSVAILLGLMGGLNTVSSFGNCKVCLEAKKVEPKVVEAMKLIEKCKIDAETKLDELASKTGMSSPSERSKFRLRLQNPGLRDPSVVAISKLPRLREESN